MTDIETIMEMCKRRNVPCVCEGNRLTLGLDEMTEMSFQIDGQLLSIMSYADGFLGFGSEVERLTSERDKAQRHAIDAGSDRYVAEREVKRLREMLLRAEDALEQHDWDLACEIRAALATPPQEETDDRP